MKGWYIKRWWETNIKEARIPRDEDETLSGAGIEAQEYFEGLTWQQTYLEYDQMPSDRVQKQIDLLLDQAESAIQRGDWALAQDRARNVLALDPSNADALSYLAAAPLSLMVNVNGASLEYLDWGGSGPPMVFLAGLSDTPYIYNELAPEFTSRFHCYGLTRRGHGRSEKTTEGYALEALVDDVAAFLEALNLTDVTLVGHSYGGTEVVRFAQRYPDTVHRAVVLDIAYASQGSGQETWSATLTQLQALVMPSQERMASLENYRRHLTWVHRSWSGASEANLREQVEIGADGRLAARMTPAISAQFGRDRSNWFLTKMPVPTLFIFSNNPTADLAQGRAVDAAFMKEIEAADVKREAQRRTQINAIQRDSPQAQIVELEHTAHRNFIHKRDRTIDEMWRFLG